MLTFASIFRQKPTRGFTIVELLVVIVTIAILSSIVIVAYNGIQNSANDAAVKSDLRSIADRMEEFRSSNPDRDYPEATQAELQDIIQVSKGSYLSNVDAGTVSYCRNDTDYALYARSKSKNVIVMTSKSGLREDISWSGNLSTQCTSAGIATTNPDGTSNGFGSTWLLRGNLNPTGAGWQSWIP